MNLPTFSERVTLTETGLELRDDVLFEEWRNVGEQLMRVERAAQWWIGDWLAFGMARDDENKSTTYADAADALGLARQTLKNYKWVAEAIPERSRTGVEWSVAREVAALPEPQRADYLDRAAAEGWTSREARKAVRDFGASDKKKNAPPIPDGQYAVIYADPPWQYSDERNLDGYDGTAASNHYPTMPIEDIRKLEVGKLAATNCALLMWATFPLLPEALTVVDAWSFKYKTAIVWDKERPNLGSYHDASAELLIVATRGSMVAENRPCQVQRIKREGRHSAKPTQFRELVDFMYPDGPRIELFAREVPQTDGPPWSIWGNEV